MKTTVYGQLTLCDKEIITITDLKKTFEKEMAKNFSDEIDLFDKRNDINNEATLRQYLSNWLDKVFKMKEREDKLNEAMNTLKKNQLNYNLGCY